VKKLAPTVTSFLPKKTTLQIIRPILIKKYKVFCPINLATFAEDHVLLGILEAVALKLLPSKFIKV